LRPPYPERCPAVFAKWKFRPTDEQVEKFLVETLRPAERLS